MKIQWVELSLQKRKALRIILKEQENGIEGICHQIGLTKATIFNKLNGKTKFKKDEYQQILKLLEITEEQLDLCSKSYILSLLL